MRLRGALLGAGNIALRGHAPQWARDEVLRREVEIVALADLSPSNLEAARAFFPEAAAYGCAEELLEGEELDFCDICTPPSTHWPLIEKAAKRGLHVLCEKPLAPSLTDAERISATVRGAGIAFQPCHQYHHAPQWQAVRRHLPRLGRIYLADYEVHRTEANEGNPNWSPSWRTDREVAGGGILVDHGAHIFYQLRTLLGEPQTVQANVRTLQHCSYRVEDTALVVLDYGQCLAQVSLTWAARRRAIKFRFVGERGEMTGDDRSLRIHADTEEEVRFEEGMSRDSSHSDWYAPLFRAFAERVRSGDRGTDPLDEALYVTRLITRAYQSSQEGRSLPLLGAPEAIEVRSGQSEPITAFSPDLALSESGVAEGAEAVPAAERRLRARVIRWSAVAAVLAAGSWTFHDVAWGPLLSALSTAQFPWVALAAAVNLAAVAFQAARWLAVVRPLSRAATFTHAFKALIVGFAVSTVVPARAGELARMQWFSRRTGIPHASVLGSIVLDHLVNAAGLLIGLAALPFFLKRVPLWIRPGAWVTLALFMVGAMLVFAMRPFRNTPAASSNLPIRGLNSLIVSLRQGLAATARPRALSLSLGASFVSWTLEVNVIMIAMRAVGLSLPPVAALLVLLAVNLALAFPVAPPGNLGTLEMGAALALLGFGVAKEQALAFGLVYHFLQILPVGILGLLILAGRRFDARVPA